MTSPPDKSAQQPTQPLRRSIVYIDGYNFYYGCVKDSPNKWLNFEKFFTLLRQHDDIQCIYYFTAKAGGAAGARQKEFLRALETCPLVRTIVARHKRKRFQCKVLACQHAGDRFYDGVEEKRTDVAIAVQMVDDAHHNRCDIQVLISGDSDLVPALERIKICHPSIKLVVYVPARDAIRGAATEIRSAADQDRTVLALLSKSQFPATIQDGAGNTITKPASW